MTTKELKENIVQALEDCKGTTWQKTLDTEGDVSGEQEVPDFNDDRAIELLTAIANKHADERSIGFAKYCIRTNKGGSMEELLEIYKMYEQKT